MEEVIARLKRKRATIKAKLTVFTKYVATLVQTLPTSKILADENAILEIRSRLAKAEPLYDEFDAIQLQIEEATDDLEPEILTRELFEADFHRYIEKARSIHNKNDILLKRDHSLSDHDSVRDENEFLHDSTTSTSSSDFMQNVKLPVISLPKFDGSYETWLEFRDTFDSLIHKNATIPPINKFHYLRACLQG